MAGHPGPASSTGNGHTLSRGIIWSLVALHMNALYTCSCVATYVRHAHNTWQGNFALGRCLLYAKVIHIAAQGGLSRAEHTQKVLFSCQFIICISSMLRDKARLVQLGLLQIPCYHSVQLLVHQAHGVTKCSVAVLAGKRV